MSDGDWIDEVLNHLQESTIIIDNTGSVLGPKEDARAFQAAKDTAKAAIEQKLNEAKQTIDVNTWSYINQYASNCVCEACVEIRKQKKRIATLQASKEEK